MATVQVKIHGLKFFVDADSPDWVSNVMRNREKYELGETAEMAGWFKLGQTFVDVGAGVGYWSVLGAQWVGPKGRVIAFEPDPRCADLARRNAAENGFKVDVREMAVGSRTGETRFWTNSGQWLNGSLTHQNVPERHGNRVSRTLGITTLDDALQGIEVDILKIDAQGEEPGIWEGAARILSRPGILVLVEIWPKGFVNAGYDPVQFLEKIRNDGFLGKLIGSSAREGEEFRQLTPNSWLWRTSVNKENLSANLLLCREPG